MIISVDHGNKSIKTPNALFTSGLIVSEGLQGFKTDYICWNNKYYTLTEQRIAYLRDKTEDERFYVLTLFAIAKELERRKVPETLDPIDITLLVGLPPAHYEQLHSRFEQYFLRRREIVDFEYNGKYYSIRVSKVLIYPQAFAAAVTQFGTLKAHSVRKSLVMVRINCCTSPGRTVGWFRMTSSISQRPSGSGGGRELREGCHYPLQRYRKQV